MMKTYLFFSCYLTVYAYISLISSHALCANEGTDINSTEATSPNGTVPKGINTNVQDELYPPTRSRDQSHNVSYVSHQYFNRVVPAYLSSSNYCTNIRTSIGLLISRIRTNSSLKAVEEAAFSDCVVTKRYPAIQCRGFVERFIPTFYYIIKKRPLLTTNTFVTNVFQSYGCNTVEYDPYMEWNVKIDPKNDEQPFPPSSPGFPGAGVKEKVEENGESATRILKRSRKPMELVKILQLSDINLDIFYKAGSNAVCEGFGPCCEADSGKPTRRGSTAGAYGDDRNCDTPDKLLDKGLQAIANQHPDVDIIYLTGDLAPHDQWRSTMLGNADVIHYVSKLIAYYFPDAAIIPIIGDQEVHPAHQFSPPGELSLISTQWVYTTTLDAWRSWLHDDQLPTFQKGGFWAVTSEEEGLKVIVLNTNICFDRNMWQLYNVRDPNDQLEWLHMQLKDAEKKRLGVHIVGHVPPGSLGCTKVWSRNYHKIIERYASIIKAQIFGHETFDTFHMFYKPKRQSEPVAVQWVAPSFTPRLSHNPSYRMYYAHPRTWEIVDYETYVMNLEFANAHPRDDPKWVRLYRATQAYGLKDLTLDSISSLVNKLAVDDSMMVKFLQFREKSLTRYDLKRCDGYCRKILLCRIVTPYLGEDAECEAIQRKVDGIVFPIYPSIT